MRKTLWALTVVGMLAGCGTDPGKTLSRQFSDDPDVEEAANDMEESKLDYENCLKDQEEEITISCDQWKEIYEEDRDAYERILKEKSAKR
jgi:uncharacterized lipoprotein